LDSQYRASLEKLGLKPGMLGVIFRGALPNPQPGASEASHAAHRQFARQGGLAIAAGGREGHDLRGIAVTLGTAIFAWRRPLLHLAAGDRGCERMQPTSADTICTAGTSGFLCTAYQYMLDRNERDLDADEKRALRENLAGAWSFPTKSAACAR
jgi:hypothetical protein